MATIRIDAGLQSLREVVHDLNQGLQADFFPSLLQRSFQRFDIRMGLRTRFFQQNIPYGIVEGVQIGAVGWPFTVGISPGDVDRDEVGTVVSNEVLGLERFVGWASILLEGPFVVSECIVSPWKEVCAQHVHVDVAIDLRALVHKDQRALASRGDACPNHHRLCLLDELDDPFFCVRLFFCLNPVVLVIERLKKQDEPHQ